MIDDPEVLAFIAAVQRLSPKGTNVATAADQRRAYDAVCAAFAYPHPDGVAVENTREGGVPLRVYTPAGARGPAVLYLHGGGFVVGSLESHDSVCADIAARTALPVVAVDYRLAPEHRHPAQLDDAETAYRFVLRRWEAPLVAGDSAGATLAAGLALRLRRLGETMPRGQVLIYPLLGDDCSGGSFVENAQAPMLTTADLAFYRAARFGGAEPAGPLAEAIPLAAADLSALPPAVASSADVDPLRDDAARFVERLAAAGVPARLGNELQLPHGFLRARRVSKRAAAAFERICAALVELSGH
jgi:acetyl esterase